MRSLTDRIRTNLEMQHAFESNFVEIIRFRLENIPTTTEPDPPYSLQ